MTPSPLLPSPQLPSRFLPARASLVRLVAAAVLCAAASVATALEIRPYSADALSAAREAGRPVAVHFHADWCPTCRAQASALRMLKDEGGLDLTVLVADYDAEKDLKRSLNIRAQSTLVVLKGRAETARLIGDTSVDALRRALETGL